MNKALQFGLLGIGLATMLPAEESRFSYGSEDCKEGADCMAADTDQPATFFLLAGQSLKDLDLANELLTIEEQTVIPAYTFIRQPR